MQHKPYLLRTLEKVLDSRWLMPISLGIVMLLMSPYLFAPLTDDDVFHKLLLSGKSIIGLDSPIMDFFTFANGDPARIQSLSIEMGIPWWANPEIKINFFRPLSAFSHWLDHQLWPKNIFMQHLVNFILFAALAFTTYKLFYVISGEKKYATLAFILFVFCIQLLLPILWIASRNALFTGIFSCLVILCYYLAVTKQWRMGFILTPILLGIGLLFGEAALAVTAFLFSAAVFLDPRKKIVAFASLIPSALVALVWLYMYQKLGYGAANSSFYIAPQHDPIEFIQRAILSIPVLFFANWYNLPPEPFSFNQTFLIAGAIFSCILIFILLFSLISPSIRKDKLFKFWMLAYLISFLPACSAPPATRTLVIPGIACIGMLIIVFKYYFESADQIERPQKIMLNIMIFMHFIFPFVFLTGAAYAGLKKPAAPITLEKIIKNYDINKHDDLIAISSKSMQTSVATANAALADAPLPANILELFSPAGDFKISRKSENEVVFSSIDSNLLYTMQDTFYFHILRDFKNKPIIENSTIQLGEYLLTVLEVTNNYLTKLQVTLPQANQDKQTLWFYFDESAHKYINFTLPNIGEEKVIEFQNSSVVKFLD